MVSLFGLLATGAMAAQMAHDLGLAGTLAAQKLEETVAACAPPAPVSRRPVDAVRFPGREWTAAVRAVAPGLWEVTVTVWWPQRGRERQVSLSTLVRGGASR